MRIVVALGGNALLKRGEPMTADVQQANVRRAAASLAELIGDGHQIVVTHGNGPQVGLLALQSTAGTKDDAYPLDILGAESEGMIGYLIERELGNCLPSDMLIATLLTQIRVDAEDPAFREPTKPIGPVYEEPVARKLADERGWRVARDGEKWRRVVASPLPIEILEMRVISLLVERNVVVICSGGGGIPVVARQDGSLIGVEAVIDKDRASALLARQLGADMLLLLTDVDGVYLDYGTQAAKRIKNVGAAALAADQFAPGSMRPKVEAAKNFVTATSHAAAIGRLEDAVAIVQGNAGTRIEAGGSNMEFRL
jgi:carbamate kinase